jgi:alkanesulfonate monooxygenase SsuD/methylene tetrahydromethanopterin reductase-like flavin-dependent oxidoreductase (luciferase family)
MLEALRESKQTGQFALNAMRSLDNAPEIVVCLLAQARAADEGTQLLVVGTPANCAERVRRSRSQRPPRGS